MKSRFVFKNLIRNIIAICIVIVFIACEYYVTIINPKFISNLSGTFLVNIKQSSKNIDMGVTETLNVEGTKKINGTEKIQNSDIELDPLVEETEVLEDDVNKVFNNTLFIGDSRTVGFNVYENIDGATYFADQSYGVFNGLNYVINIPKYGNISLFDLLTIHKFDKIILCLGVNNLGTSYENHEKTFRKYLDDVIALQPNAKIYLIANLHVTKEQDEKGDYVNNTNINAVNSFIKNFADGNKIIYLDPNPLYDDQDGCLAKELSYDNCHIKVKHYDLYKDFLIKIMQM